MAVEAPVTGIAPTKIWIETLLREHPRMKGVDGYIDGLAPGQMPKTDDFGRLNRYWVLTYGGRAKVRSGLQNIGSTRDDIRRLYFGVELYSKDANDLMLFEDDVVDVLEGAEPPNAGEISLEFSGRIENPIELKQNHTRDGRGLIFECYVNTTVPNPTV